MDQTKFYSDFPFTKAAVAGGDLKLLGYASTWTLDRDQEMVLPSAFEGSLEKYLDSNPILLWQHDLKQPIGTVENAFVDQYGLNVKAHVAQPDDREPDWSHLAYNKIKSGIVRTFSIGGFFERGVKNGKRVITRTNLYEISVVSVPSNPDSIFAAAVKSLTGSTRPDLTPEALAQMAQLIGMKTVTSPEIAGMGEDERKERYGELADMYKQAGVKPPSYDGWREWIANAEPDPVKRLPSALRFMAEVQGREPVEKDVESAIEEMATLNREIRDGEETKVGRVLSRANEDKIRRMMKLGDEILAHIEKQREEEEAVTPGEGKAADTETGDGEAVAGEADNEAVSDSSEAAAEETGA